MDIAVIGGIILYMSGLEASMKDHIGWKSDMVVD